jgi:hypothetical protein
MFRTEFLELEWVVSTAVGLVVGFVLGYCVRVILSHRRSRRLQLTGLRVSQRRDFRLEPPRKMIEEDAQLRHAGNDVPSIAPGGIPSQTPDSARSDQDAELARSSS